MSDFCLLAPCAPPSQGFSADFRAFSSHETLLAQAVWRIENYYNNKAGTGFFIEMETEFGPALYFVTNFHVMRGMWGRSDISVSSYKIFLSQRTGYGEGSPGGWRRKKAPIRRVFASALYDLALLEMSEDFPSRRLELRTDPLSPYERVFSIGYPRGRLRKISQKQSFLTGSYLNLTGDSLGESLIFKTEELEFPDDGASLLISKTKKPAALLGASGSPVFDQKGKAAGIAYAVVYSKLFSFNASPMMIAAPARRLQKILSSSAGVECPHFISAANCADRAINNLERLAAQGPAAVKLTLALELEEWAEGWRERDMERSKKWLIKAAKANNAPAQQLLGHHYLFGSHSVYRDSEEAGLRQAGYWYLRYILNYPLPFFHFQETRAGSGSEGWEARAENAVEDWETLLSP